MLSSVFPPATVNPVPSDSLFKTTLIIPWNTNKPLVYTTQEPVESFSGSDHDSTPKTNSSGSGSEDDRPLVVDRVDERKRRRMTSNRESARRSRMRKQQHLEALRILVNRNTSRNRELMKWLRFALYHVQIIGHENERLQSESAMLRQKLWDLDNQPTLVCQLPNKL